MTTKTTNSINLFHRQNKNLSHCFAKLLHIRRRFFPFNLIDDDDFFSMNRLDNKIHIQFHLVNELLKLTVHCRIEKNPCMAKQARKINESQLHRCVSSILLLVEYKNQREEIKKK